MVEHVQGKKLLELDSALGFRICELGFSLTMVFN